MKTQVVEINKFVDCYDTNGLVIFDLKKWIIMGSVSANLTFFFCMSSVTEGVLKHPIMLYACGEDTAVGV